MTYKDIKIISIGCGSRIIGTKNEKDVETIVKKDLKKMGKDISEYNINNFVDDFVNVDCEVSKIEELYLALLSKYNNALVSFTLEKNIDDDSEDNGFNLIEITFEKYIDKIENGLLKLLN